MTEKRPLIVGIGEILWDMFPGGKEIGGTVANFAYHAGGLGADAIVVSCVGDDELGREMLEQFEAVGLGTDFISIDPEHPTGTVDIEVRSDGEPSYTIRTGVAWDFAAGKNTSSLAASADVACFGSLAQRNPVSRATIRNFLSATRESCLRVCDINFRQNFFSLEVVTRSLEHANVLKVNDEELPVVADLLELEGDDDVLLRQLAERFDLRLVALTSGERGSLLYSGGEFSSHPGVPVDVVDTVGAGDAFTAALAMALLAGDQLETINAKANSLAAYVCSKKGGTPELPQERPGVAT